MMKTLPPTATHTETTKKPRAQKDGWSPRLQNHRSILVVDDDESVCIGICETLKDAGFDAIYATNGKDAIRSVKSAHCSLIFMDMMMPGLNGLDTYRKIREVSPVTRVVLFTGYFKDVDKAIYTGIREGMIDVYLRKPFYAEEIISTAMRFC